jgi:hypothetical protein
METPAVASLQAQAEPLASLSISHLSSSTRLKLADDELSVNAYPTDCGGILYVGMPCHRIPTEADLAAIFEVAQLAGVVWLNFDSEAAVIDGLPIFEMPDPHHEPAPHPAHAPRPAGLGSGRLRPAPARTFPAGVSLPGERAGRR